VAERLTKGLEVVIASGEMDKLFFKYFDGVIDTLDLKNRRLFILENPFLLDHPPLEPKDLWFKAHAGKAHAGTLTY
jgi:hypothetical protein